MNLFYNLKYLYPALSPNDCLIRLNEKGQDIVYWNTEKLGPKPTKESLIAVQEYADRLQAIEETRLNRLSEYPPIGDQLDALWKGGQEMELMRQKIIAIKEKYPLP